MPDKVDTAYNLAKKDTQFHKDYIKGSKTGIPPEFGWFVSDLDKAIMATLYIGWLSGKGEFELIKSLGN